VSAVLDFELAGPDLRALDVAIPLVFWPMPDDEPGRWATYETFVRGYASVTPLSGAELNALPVISLGAVLAFLIGSIGECLEEADRWDRVVPLLVRRALTHGAWLAANEERFIERLHASVGR
jgi:Ser/Thr protein kinase RdoA (MazF antagonist)